MINITEKTQFDNVEENRIIHGDVENIEFEQSSISINGSNNIIAVSYTHLTLPTNPAV